jgi:hypothetical protein
VSLNSIQNFAPEQIVPQSVGREHDDIAQAISNTDQIVCRNDQLRLAAVTRLVDEGRPSTIVCDAPQKY